MNEDKKKHWDSFDTALLNRFVLAKAVWQLTKVNYTNN